MAGRTKEVVKKKSKKPIKKTVNKSKKKQNKTINKEKYLIVGILVALLIILLSITFSYAFWVTSKTQSNVNEVTAGCLSFSLDDKDINGNSTSIYLPNAYPMKDERGLITTPYVLTISNTCSIETNIFLNIHNLESSSIDSKYIKVNLADDTNSSILGPIILKDIESGTESFDNESEVVKSVGKVKESYLLSNFLLKPKESKTISLRMWIDYDAPNDIMGLSYNSAVSVYATTPQ